MLRTETKKLKPLADLVSLRGKTALITGSASGIGKAMAYRFAEAGANLELVDINEEKLRTTQNDLSELNVKIDTYKVDLGKKSEIEQLWTKLKGKAPDILVNNAGIYPLKNFFGTGSSVLAESHGHQLELDLVDVPEHDKSQNKAGRRDN